VVLQAGPLEVLCNESSVASVVVGYEYSGLPGHT
jgi:hypothetical protein